MTRPPLQFVVRMGSVEFELGALVEKDTTPQELRHTFAAALRELADHFDRRGNDHAV